MKETTINSMNLLGKKNSARINTVVPSEVKRKLVEVSKRLEMSESQFIKIAVIEKLNQEI